MVLAGQLRVLRSNVFMAMVPGIYAFDCKFLDDLASRLNVDQESLSNVVLQDGPVISCAHHHLDLLAHLRSALRQ